MTLVRKIKALKWNYYQYNFLLFPKIKLFKERISKIESSSWNLKPTLEYHRELKNKLNNC